MKQSLNKTKIGWTLEEEAFLETLCKNKRKIDWKLISCQINDLFPNKNRTSKQCRQRFHNFIKFNGQNALRSPWTAGQDQILFDMYIEVGSKWAEIAKCIPGRSENNIKNRFYGEMRKLLRMLNETLRGSYLRNRKPIKEATITKILLKDQLFYEINKSSTNIIGLSKNFLNNLKLKIVQFILKDKSKIQKTELIETINQIHRFNNLMKTENIRQNRKGKKNKRKFLPPLGKKTSRDQLVDSQSDEDIKGEEKQAKQSLLIEQEERSSTAQSQDKPIILKDLFVIEKQIEEQIKNQRLFSSNFYNQLNQIFPDVCQGQFGFMS